MGPIQAFVAFHTRVFDFAGRSSRAEYWWSALMLILAFFGVAFAVVSTPGAMEHQLAPGAAGLMGLYLLWFWLATISMSIRRLHDAGYSGWWYLINFIPLGGLVLLVLFCFPSEPWPNAYGPAPQGPDAEGRRAGRGPRAWLQAQAQCLGWLCPAFGGRRRPLARA
mgnify:CR=1 FL=1